MPISHKISIGFTKRTGKIMPRIFCRNFRHCAIVIKRGKHYMLMHKVADGIQILKLSPRDLEILAHNGWEFVNVRCKMEDGRLTACIHLTSYIVHLPFTCVSFCKKMLGIKNPFIQTTDQLYKYCNLRFRDLRI
jgi:hypothetical protein